MHLLHFFENIRKPHSISFHHNLFHPLNHHLFPHLSHFFSVSFHSLEPHFGGPPAQHDLKARVHVLPEHQQRQVPPALCVHEAHQARRRALGVLQLDAADGVGVQLQLEAAVQGPEVASIQEPPGWLISNG